MTNRKRLSKFLLIMMVTFIALLGFGFVGQGVTYAEFIDNTPINGTFNENIANTSNVKEEGWWEDTKDWVSETWDDVTDWCSETWDDVNNILDDLGAKIEDIMDTAWKWGLAVGSALTVAWALLKKQIPALQVVEWAFSFIKGILRGLADIVIGVFDLVVGALGLIGYIILNPIESGKKLWHWITHPGEVWNNISNMVGGVWNEITESWDRMVVNGDANSRSEWLGYATTQIVGIFVGTKGLEKAGKAGSVVSKAGGISSRFPLASKAFDAISDSFKGFGDKVKSFGDNLFGNAKRILATTTAGAMLLTGITFVWPKIEPYIMKFSDCVAIQQVQDTRHYFASMQLAGKIDCPSISSDRLIPGTPGRVTGGNSTKLGKNLLEDMDLPRSSSRKGYQAQHIIPSEMRNHPVIQKVGMDFDDASNGIFLPVPNDKVHSLATHRGYHSSYNQAVENELNKLDVNQSTRDLEKQVHDLQQRLKYLQKNGLPLYPSKGGSLDLWDRWLNK